MAADPRRPGRETVSHWPVVAAVVGIAPYVGLKTAWLLGQPLGVHDQAIVSSLTFVVANAMTLASDLVLLFLVRALLVGYRWIPSGALRVTSWIGIGLLVGAVTAAGPGLVVVVASRSWPEASSGLEPWVYLVVYLGFAVQATALVGAWSASGFAAARTKPSSGHRRAARPAAALAVSVAAALLGVAAGVPGTAETLHGAVERSDIVVDSIVLALATAGTWRVATWPAARHVWWPVWWVTFVGTGAAATWGAYEASLAWAGLTGGATLAVLQTMRAVAAGWLAWVALGSVEHPSRLQRSGHGDWARRATARSTSRRTMPRKGRKAIQ